MLPLKEMPAQKVQRGAVVINSPFKLPFYMSNEVVSSEATTKSPRISFIIGGILIFAILFGISFWYIQSQQKPSVIATKAYNKQQAQNSDDIAQILGISGSTLPPVTEANVAAFIRYANSLTRQNDFGYSKDVNNFKKAIAVYQHIVSSNISPQYKAFSLNEMYTVFVQSGSNPVVIEQLFSAADVNRKMQTLNLNVPFENLKPGIRLIVYQNLLMDKLLQSISLQPTKIALARVSMQEYMNQMLYRTQIDITSQASSSQNTLFKNTFSAKVLRNYELYKIANANTLAPYSFYEAEAAYLMAWSLNRAGVYSENQESIDESYKLFEENITRLDALKKTSQDVWHLSIFTKMFYATAVLGSNKDAYIDPGIKENRDKALSILSELASPEFLEDRRYYGARSYLTSMMKSDMDWITTLLLLAEYDDGLTKNLKALKWSL